MGKKNLHNNAQNLLTAKEQEASHVNVAVKTITALLTDC